MREASLQSIYISQIAEATSRLFAAKNFLSSFVTSATIPDLDAATLQVRKALETIAFAAIAPDKKQYAAFRATATNCPDFTKDYHAAKIFTALAKINKDFYPRALIPAVRKPDGTYHFGSKQSGYLTKSRFKAVYDRLGKHLHAHNPWSKNKNKNLRNLAHDLSTIIEETSSLLDIHARFIKTSEFNGVWVCEINRQNNIPRILTAVAAGSYVISDS